MTPSVGELRRLVEEATPGPWARTKPFKRGGFTLPWPSILGLDGAEVVKWGGFDGCDVSKQETRANIALICAMRNALPALLDRLEKLEAAIRKHQHDVWGAMAVGHHSDRELYAALASLAVGETPP